MKNNLYDTEKKSILSCDKKTVKSNKWLIPTLTSIYLTNKILYQCIRDLPPSRDSPPVTRRHTRRLDNKQPPRRSAWREKRRICWISIAAVGTWCILTVSPLPSGRIPLYAHAAFSLYSLRIGYRLIGFPICIASTASCASFSSVSFNCW